MSTQPERRFVPLDGLELRATDEDGKRRVSGYFAVYDSWSPLYGRFRERIAPGFFDEAMGRDDVRALFNHDTNLLLGRSKSGTLKLRSDEKGLHGEIDPIPQTPTGTEVLENLKLRNLTGASFAFSLAPDGDKWSKAEDGTYERTLLKIGRLFDVSVVTEPFYPQTEVGLREVRSDLQASFDRWAEAHPEEVEPPDELTYDRDEAAARIRLASL